MRVRLGLTVWQIGHESCGWPPATWPQSCASIFPPSSNSNMFVFMCQCFPAKEMMSGSCYDSDESCPRWVFSNIRLAFASTGRVSYVRLPLSSSAVLFLSFLPIHLWEHVQLDLVLLCYKSSFHSRSPLFKNMCLHEQRLWNAGGGDTCTFCRPERDVISYWGGTDQIYFLFASYMKNSSAPDWAYVPCKPQLIHYSLWSLSLFALSPIHTDTHTLFDAKNHLSIAALREKVHIMLHPEENCLFECQRNMHCCRRVWFYFTDISYYS